MGNEIIRVYKDWGFPESGVFLDVLIMSVIGLFGGALILGHYLLGSEFKAQRFLILSVPGLLLGWK